MHVVDDDELTADDTANEERLPDSDFAAKLLLPLSEAAGDNFPQEPMLAAGDLLEMTGELLLDEGVFFPQICSLLLLLSSFLVIDSYGLNDGLLLESSLTMTGDLSFLSLVLSLDFSRLGNIGLLFGLSAPMLLQV